MSRSEVCETAIESGPYIRVPGGDWAFLDAVKGNCPPFRLKDPREGCKRWPEGWYLVNERTGECVQGRCGATNLCEYCRGRYLRETAAVLRAQCSQVPPTVYLVLTAREFLSRADCRRHLEHVRRALLRHWTPCEWFLTVEIQKRGALHLNLLLRGPEAAESPWVWSVAARRWCSRVDALPVGQHAEPVFDSEGVERYCAKFERYITKSSQQPAIGWSGHRTSQTRGFFPAGMRAMREQVRAALVWRVFYGQALDSGLRGLAAVSWATNARAILRQDVWTLRDVSNPHAPRLTHLPGAEPLAARAQRCADKCPSSSVQSYVNDHLAQAALFATVGSPDRNRGPMIDMS